MFIVPTCWNGSDGYLAGVVPGAGAANLVPLAILVNLDTVLVGPGVVVAGWLVVLPGGELSGCPGHSSLKVTRECQGSPVRKCVAVFRVAAQTR